MSERSFNELCNELRPCLQKQNTHLRKTFVSGNARCSYTILSTISRWDVVDLTEEKSTIIEEIATGIAKEIGHHVGTVCTESL